MRSGLPLSILWIGLAACGRFGFTDERRIDAAIADTAVADTAPVARCDWSAGPPFTQPAMLRPELSMPDTDYDPFLVPGDPLTINYVARIGSSGELFEAHRASTLVPFDAPVLRSDLSTPTMEESGLALERGGRHGYYVSNASGTNQIYEVGRVTPTDPLQVIRRLSELSPTGDRFDPWPFADGLALAYLERQPAMPDQLRFASRATTTDPWSMSIEVVFGYPNVSGVTLTSDGLIAVFSADGTSGTKDIFYATRAALTDAFGTVQPLEAASSLTFGDHEPSVRDDGCELFFARDSGPGGKWDIYSVPAVAP